MGLAPSGHLNSTYRAAKKAARSISSITENPEGVEAREQERETNIRGEWHITK